MKISVVLAGKSADLSKDAPPRTIVIGHVFELLVLSSLLLCAIALVIWNSSPAFRFGSTAVSTPKTSGGQFVSAIPARVIARPFDGSRPLKAGDLVVVNGQSGPTLRQVAAAPNETVLLRSGNTLKALYLVGDSSYVVVADQKISTVRPEAIRATLASTAGF